MIAIADLTQWLQAPDGDIALLSDLEPRAVAFVERSTGRHFGVSQAFVEILEGRGTDTLWLNEEPASITSVRERAQTGDSWTTVVEADADGFELRGARLIRKGVSKWTDGYEVEVTYNFGYAVDAEPGEIRQLVIDLVKLKYDLRDVEQGLESEKVGPVAVSYANGEFTGELAQIPWVNETLAAWRRPRLA